MSRRQFAATALAVCGILFASTRQAGAQIGPGTGNGNNGIGQASGILIDPQGVVALKTTRASSPNSVKKQVERFAQEQLPADVIAESPSRVLSLKRLDELVGQHLQKSGSAPVSLQFLAGLQRIDQIIIDEERKDVYLVGPAEGFGPDHLNRMVGQNSGRPPLRLDDLVTALRAVASGTDSIGCSIDPTDENMARLQQYLAQNSFPATRAQVQMRFQTMSQVLGIQQIALWGVPENSPFAAALVEADFRMKRIALGLEPSGVPGLRSHLSLLKPQGNSLQRWWFVPMYDALETNAEGTVYLLKGQRVKLLAQEELSDPSGRRSDAPLTRESTQLFAKLFTEHYPELAERSVPFAQLQNLYDLALLAAILKEKNSPLLEAEAAGLRVLMADTRLPQQQFPAPKSVPSASTFRAAGSGTLIGLVGGVTIPLRGLLNMAAVRPIESSTPVTLSDGNFFEDASPQR